MNISSDFNSIMRYFAGANRQIYHFARENSAGASVDDYIIFPQDATFDKVDTSRPNDRVYVLQYKGSSRRFFYWMQVYSMKNVNTRQRMFWIEQGQLERC
ncbi:hypothetical protein AC1031_011409 [Aphanomyces cochlioides]|nr:hypothetical protein AC1031_011409 [Aphanomyces cochlioides]